VATKTFTNEFKQFLADQLFHHSSETTGETIYLIGTTADYDTANGAAEVTDSVYESLYKVHDKLLFGKKMEQANFRYMIRNVPWEAGQTYDIYDDKDGDLPEKDFYVVADQDDGTYAVFKCLYKKPTGNPTTINKPLLAQTSAEDEIYITGDGYQWKYMTTISAQDYTDFATSNYVPITEDVNVTANAVAGALEAVKIESGGSNYNNYSSGTIKESAVGGNTLRYSLQADTFFEAYTYDLIYTSNDNSEFAEGETVQITVPGANTVEADVYKTGPSSISVRITANTENITQSAIEAANSNITVEDSNTSAYILRARTEDLPLLSRDDDFYVGSVIYIRSGLGAGQVRDIADYEVTGDQRIITVNTAFDTAPNSTSSFSILPKIDIDGDGSGAIFLPVMSTNANNIIDVQIINRGSGYSWATASVSGNTGILDSNGQIVIANNATITPIISPKGGHGSNITRELYAHNIGVATTLSNTDVMNYVSYTQFALIKDLLHNDIQLTADAVSAGEFSEGEVVIQDTTLAQGEVVSVDDANNIITLTNVLGEFSISNNTVTGQTSNNTFEVVDINRDVSTFDNIITIGVNVTSGTFEAGEYIVQDETGATGYVVKNNTSSLELVNVQGTFTTALVNRITGQNSGARAFVSSISQPRIVDNSGDVFYIENSPEIVRTPTSSEKIKIVIKF